MNADQAEKLRDIILFMESLGITGIKVKELTDLGNLVSVVILFDVWKKEKEAKKP